MVWKRAVYRMPGPIIFGVTCYDRRIKAGALESTVHRSVRRTYNGAPVSEGE